MKFIAITFLALTLALGFTNNPTNTPQDISDEKKVEEAVLKWAADTFYKNEGKRFERFYAEYSDEYYIFKLKTEMYEKKLRRIKKQKESGSYPKSDSEYEEEVAGLTKKINDAVEMAKSVSPKVSEYSIKYWTNVQLSNGILVYYSFELVLDDNYKVVSHKIADKIGDKDDNATIVYK